MSYRSVPQARQRRPSWPPRASKIIYNQKYNHQSGLPLFFNSPINFNKVRNLIPTPTNPVQPIFIFKLVNLNFYHPNYWILPSQQQNQPFLCVYLPSMTPPTFDMENRYIFFLKKKLISQRKIQLKIYLLIHCEKKNLSISIDLRYVLLFCFWFMFCDCRIGRKRKMKNFPSIFFLCCLDDEID